MKYKFFLVFVLILLQSCSSAKIYDTPGEPRIITSDIDNSYEAFDQAVVDTAHAERIFTEFYFEKGTKGLQDFYKSKIKSIQEFSDFVLKHKEFYQSIRKDITNLHDLRDQIKENFSEFERLYPDAKFPDVYFLIGSFRSNGTISKNGLLIGTEILSRTPDSDTSSWSDGILKISMNRSHIPITVNHELIHFNQNKMAGGNTLLWKSMREGSAEFIAELISGETDADFADFHGREIEVWRDFQQDKNKNTWRSWQQESEQRPRNAGYWAGYMICKAYFEQIGNKEKMIQDLLHVKNYEEFYRKSRVDKYIQENFGS